MSNENGLVLNATSYGIEESKAKQLEKVFVPMVEKFKELEEQYNEVISNANKEMTKDVALDATLVKRKYVKVRTGTDETHKIAKQSNLIEGRAIDGLRNLVKFACNDHEESLKKVSDHYEILEAERLQFIRDHRTMQLAKYYNEDGPGTGDLALMSDEVWKHYIKSVEVDYHAKREAEILAEKERIAKEKAEIEEQKRIKAENEKLKKEAELKRIADEKAEKERERLEKIERDKREKEEHERQLKADAERKERLVKQEEERKAHEAILQKERDEKLKIQKELEAKQEEEREIKALDQARIEKEADEQRKLELAPDKEKLEKWVLGMSIEDIETGNMSNESIEIAIEIRNKYGLFRKWAFVEINKIK